MVSAGDVPATLPREAVISEIDGIVKHGGIVKGQRKIIIVPDEPGAEPREYSLPRGVHVNVQEGERVRAGEPLMDRRRSAGRWRSVPNQWGYTHEVKLRALIGIFLAKDVVVWTPAEVDAWRDVPHAFITTAVREGRTLYER